MASSAGLRNRNKNLTPAKNSSQAPTTAPVSKKRPAPNSTPSVSQKHQSPTKKSKAVTPTTPNKKKSVNPSVGQKHTLPKSKPATSTTSKKTSGGPSASQKHQSPLKKQKTSHNTTSTSANTSGLSAQTKKPLTFQHEAFEVREIESGVGLKHHAFSTVSLKTTVDQDKYIKSTGLTPIKTVQDWGAPKTGPKSAKLGPSTMHRSRRGSLVGLSPMPDGSIKGWRLHSLPTSEALEDRPADEATFKQTYAERAERLTKPVVNSKDNPQSINAVVSDFAKVRFNTITNAFEVYDATHARGVSGKGLDNKQSSSPATLYAPSIEVAKADGKSGSPAQTYHSEPMAITLHNSHRTTTLENETNMLGMFASFPNQVCFQCGRTFAEKSGTNAVVSGVPGVHFGGQHEGGTFDSTKGTTVLRAAPIEDLRNDATNTKEIGSIYDHHKR